MALEGIRHFRRELDLTRGVYHLPYLAGFLFILIFSLYPIGAVLVQSFRDRRGFTLKYYQTFFQDPYYYTIIFNSLKVAFCTAAIALTLGTLFAVLVYKTDLPVKKLLQAGVLLPMITPGYIVALVYVYLFGRNGLITCRLLGLEPNIYGWKSVVFLQSIGATVTAFLLISSVLLTIPQEVEEAAANLGSSEGEIFRRVTLPLLWPGILSAGLLIIMGSIADFGTPIIVGGNFHTLASAAYFEIIGKFNPNMAATLSVFLLLPSLILFGIFNRLFKGYGQKVGRIRRFALKGPAAFLLSLPPLLYTLLTFTFFVSAFLAAFTKYFGYDFSLTFEYMKVALGLADETLDPMKNTIIYATVTGVAVAFLGMAFAYLVLRGDYRGKKYFDFAVLLPFAVPGTFMGIGYLLAFHNPPLVLTGTALIIMLNCLVRELPVAYRMGYATLAQIDKSIEEASFNLGADRFTTFYRVVLPLMRQAATFSMIYAFNATAKALGAIIFLVTAHTKVLSVKIFEATINRHFGVGAAYSLFMVAITGIGMLLIWRLGGEPLGPSRD